MIGRRYLRLQLKRIIRLAVGIIPTAILLFACLAIAAVLYLNYGPNADKCERIKIGIAGDTQDSYLGMGILAIQSFDDTKYLVDFIEMDSSKKAQEAFLNGEIAGYLVIPDGFIDSVVYGRNDEKITYVVSKEQKGLAGMLMDDLSKIAESLIICSQNAVYGMQEILIENGGEENYNNYTNELNLKLIDQVLSRTQLADVKILGISLGLGTMDYYFVAVSLLFCFLLGICGAPFFWNRRNDLGMLLRQRGVRSFSQIFSEYIAYILFLLIATYIPIIVSKRIFEIFFPRVLTISAGDLLPAMLSVVLLAGAFHFLLFEIVQQTISSILVQSVLVTAMGYLSGFMFPAYFFPERLAEIGRKLPTGCALRYVSDSVSKTDRFAPMIGMVCYTILFLGMTLIIRKRRLCGDER